MIHVAPAIYGAGTSASPRLAWFKEPTLASMLESAREKAAFFTAKRRKDAQLYAVLGECLTICELAEATGQVDALRHHVAQAPLNGRNRTYVERQSDIYLIVGRYVFGGEKHRAATWRYTAVIREAAKREISGAGLPAWLAANGGANALFRTRPVERRSFSTRTLHLTSPVEAFKGQEITLTLRARADGFFDVVAA